MAASLMHMRRIEGVLRPAIVQPIPSARGAVVLVDCGANADPRAEHLLQFAYMGSAFATAILNVRTPSIGLLSIGEEAGKGNALDAGGPRAAGRGGGPRLPRERRGPRHPPRHHRRGGHATGSPATSTLKAHGGRGRVPDARDPPGRALGHPGQDRRGPVQARAAAAARQDRPRGLRRRLPRRPARALGDRPWQLLAGRYPQRHPARRERRAEPGRGAADRAARPGARAAAEAPAG